MPGVGIILVPYSGGFETRLNASQAKSQQEIDDPVRATRLSELVDQRPAMNGVKFMLTTKGVLMHGTDSQALIMSRLVCDLPNLTPSEKSFGANIHTMAAANDDNHIALAFGEAARPFKVASMRPEFSAAANDEQFTTVRWGSRPAINGSYGARVLAAA